ncbi:hypothetical protein [Gordonia sihwensis]|uniref:hypothetical protein n=1 Tax=Gordonia sihwensis TaxID=173559 RepID=UPI001E5E86A4|nr:hypothetical protein [Gordonia sihwensis]
MPRQQCTGDHLVETRVDVAAPRPPTETGDDRVPAHRPEEFLAFADRTGRVEKGLDHRDRQKVEPFARQGDRRRRQRALGEDTGAAGRGRSEVGPGDQQLDERIVGPLGEIVGQPAQRQVGTHSDNCTAGSAGMAQ